jgi:predicted site-specific integrase-resolvase
MNSDLTPASVRDGATRAHLRLSEFLDRAGVSASTFYRWATDGKGLHPVNRQKLAETLAELEAAQ